MRTTQALRLIEKDCLNMPVVVPLSRTSRLQDNVVGSEASELQPYKEVIAAEAASTCAHQYRSSWSSDFTVLKFHATPGLQKQARHFPRITS